MKNKTFFFILFLISMYSIQLFGMIEPHTFHASCAPGSQSTWASMTYIDTKMDNNWDFVIISDCHGNIYAFWLNNLRKVESDTDILEAYVNVTDFYSEGESVHFSIDFQTEENGPTFARCEKSSFSDTAVLFDTGYIFANSPEKSEDSDMIVNPNYLTKEILIRIPEDEEISRLEIYDMTGNLASSRNFSDMTASSFLVSD